LDRLSQITTSANPAAVGAAGSFAGNWVRVPELVHVQDGVLEWSSEEQTAADMRLSRIDEACLRRFIRLADAPEKQIVSFANRYGPLYLGTRGYPVDDQHGLPIRREPGEGAPRSKGKSPFDRLWFQEPIEGWRAWARYLGTVLVLGYELRRGERLAVPERRLTTAGLNPGPRNWEIEERSRCLTRGASGELALSGLGETVYETLWPWRLIDFLTEFRTVDEQWRARIADLSMHVLEKVPYRVAISGIRQSPRVVLVQPWRHRSSLEIHHALPTIVGQMLALLTGEEHTQLCAGCSLPYPVQRRHQNGRCPECGLKARSASVQRSKARKRERDAANTPTHTPTATNTSELP
jgi:hypothetical protein